MPPSSRDVSLIDRLAVEGLADWLDPGWIASETRSSGVIVLDDFRTMTVGTAAQMILSGLAVVGDVDRYGFHPWPGNPAATVRELTLRLDALPLDDWRPGEGFWLRLTSTGKERGQEVLAGKDLFALNEEWDERPVSTDVGVFERILDLIRGRDRIDAASVYRTTFDTDVENPEDRACLALGVVVRAVVKGVLVPQAPDGGALDPSGDTQAVFVAAAHEQIGDWVNGTSVWFRAGAQPSAPQAS